jgi:hypothetical protein
MAVIELGSWNKQPKGVTHSYVGARSGLVDLLPAIIYLFSYLFIYLFIYLSIYLFMLPRLPRRSFSTTLFY